MSRSEAAPPGASGPPHPGEQHHDGFAGRLNWLRAGVLGANDGIVSVAGVVIGVAGATTQAGPIALAGAAALIAGALSMAGGEYVSVSTQRDTERAALRLEEWELRTYPQEELEELAGMYRERGLSEQLAQQVAEELTARDALRAHAESEFGFTPGDLTSPWTAALSSLISFTVGALLPLIAILLPIGPLRIPVTVVAVLVGLALTGYFSARLGKAVPWRAVLRNLAVGIVTMGLTYAAGTFFGGVV